MINTEHSRAYQPIFDPPETTEIEQADGANLVYCWGKEVKLAVNVALATGRALLLQGEPGVGKSAVAEAVAQHLNWRFYRYPVSSRTEAQDLTWKIDHVRRLADAQSQNLCDDDTHYLMPGPFWWAFDGESAARRGSKKEAAISDPANLASGEQRSPFGAVVLIDEIDKADPAVANDLLETVGAARFWVDGVANPFPVLHRPPAMIEKGGLLMVFTSNNERDMPEAFLRRCIVETMAWPESQDAANKPGFDDELKKIAKKNWERLGSKEPKDAEGAQASLLLDGLIEAIWKQRIDHKNRDKRPPGLAEFLDAIAACRELGVVPGSGLWNELARLVWSKDSIAG